MPSVEPAGHGVAKAEHTQSPRSPPVADAAPLFAGRAGARNGARYRREVVVHMVPADDASPHRPGASVPEASAHTPVSQAQALAGATRGHVQPVYTPWSRQRKRAALQQRYGEDVLQDGDADDADFWAP